MITASQVKELREKTGAGMMDCKKALEETDGDLNRAVDWLREKGIAKAAKKAGRIAAEGLTRCKVKGNLAVVYEINSETDFVAKNEQFQELLDLTGDALLAAAPATLDDALNAPVGLRTVNDYIVDATATIGEKITLRRFALVSKADDEVFGSYIHMGGKIAVVVKLSPGSSFEVAKDMAMQVASMNPSFISRNDMPVEYIDHERNIQREIIKNDEVLANKPEKVREGIMEGRLSKQLQEVSLVDQIYFKDQDKKVSEILKNERAVVFSFVRYAVGEGIEKKEDNFAADVANTFAN
jgi:elongation factor Ts